MPRPQDNGALSAHRDFGEAEAALKQQRLSGFGLCALDVAEMEARTAGKVWVEFAPTRPSRSHVRIYGCDAPEVQAVLADLAEMVHRPRWP